MILLTSPVSSAFPPLTATIGFFDGVHRGHRFLIDQVKETAVREGRCAALVTFPTHPRQVLQSTYRPQLLTTSDEKLALLETTGVDYGILLPFTRELSKLSARDFMQLLYDRYHIRTLVIGYDHRFGHNREEGFADYVRYGAELGLHIEQARAFHAGEQHISSSAIRALLHAGEVASAAQLLGYPYFLQGQVVSGHQIGRRLGFPTANLQVNANDKLLPAHGVYAIRAEVEGMTYGGMLNIGCRPTLANGDEVSIEAHLFGFEGNLYDRSLRVSFIARLRSEKKFDSLEALMAQMETDRQQALSLLQSVQKGKVLSGEQLGFTEG